MRTLTIDEASVVSGGDDCELDEVVVTGKRPARPQIYAQAFDYCSWAPSGGGGGWGGGGLEEVVITGKRETLLDYMTFDQLAAALSKDWEEIKGQWGEIWDFFTEDDDVLSNEKSLSEMSPEEILKFWNKVMSDLNPAQRAALAAALLSASTNNALEPWSPALAAMSGAVAGNNPNWVADAHCIANKQGYGLALDSAVKGVLDQVRFGP